MHWMKESEAKEKWCPATRIRQAIILDAAEVASNTNCLGHGCACWQPQFSDRRELGRCGLMPNADYKQQ